MVMPVMYRPEIKLTSAGLIDDGTLDYNWHVQCYYPTGILYLKYIASSRFTI